MTLDRKKGTATQAASTVYRRAITLNDALERYSRADLWNRFAALHATPALIDFAIEAGTFVTPQLKNNAPPKSDSPLGVIAELGAEFIVMLVGRRLLGAGYRIPKLRGAQPVWIAAKHWEGAKVIWRSRNQADLLFADVQYQEVRFEPSVELRDELRQSSKAAVKAPPGRKTWEPEIIAAWNALTQAGGLPKTGTIQSKFPVVRAKVHELFPHKRGDKAGLGNSVLYRVLKERWKAYKAAGRGFQE
jgi:hypothetical protein